jgi:hypothetical protein
MAKVAMLGSGGICIGLEGVSQSETLTSTEESTRRQNPEKQHHQKLLLNTWERKAIRSSFTAVMGYFILPVNRVS